MQSFYCWCCKLSLLEVYILTAVVRQSIWLASKRLHSTDDVLLNTQFFDVLGEMGTGAWSSLPSMSDSFAPLFVNDHVVAV